MLNEHENTRQHFGYPIGRQAAKQTQEAALAANVIGPGLSQNVVGNSLRPMFRYPGQISESMKAKAETSGARSMIGHVASLETSLLPSFGDGGTVPEQVDAKQEAGASETGNYYHLQEYI